MDKSRKNHFFNRLWKEDVGMTIMLVLISATNFIIQPIFYDATYIGVSNEVFFILVTLSGIWLLIEDKRAKILVTLIPLIYILTSFAYRLYPNEIYLIVKIPLVVAIFLIITYLILMRIFGPGPINNHKIIGAILVFLLAGNMFTGVYDILYKLIPNSFYIPTEAVASKASHITLLFFSYTTLTTTGYGDITPLHPIAKSIVAIEQLFGLLYPVLLISRLVSLSLNHKKEHEK